MLTVSDRRARGLGDVGIGRRKYPRLALDVDWFLDSDSNSYAGRGLDITLRGARLPCRTVPSETFGAALLISLPGRTRMFRARGSATSRHGVGIIVVFSEVVAEDMQLLTDCLVREHGVMAIPQLRERLRKYGTLAPKYFSDSTQPGELRY